MKNIREIKKALVDKETGISIAKLTEGKNVSLHVAKIKKELKLHYHKRREEIYHLIKGVGILILGKNKIKMKEGDVVLIPRETIHGIKNISRKNLFLVFISSPPFDPSKDRIFV